MDDRSRPVQKKQGLDSVVLPVSLRLSLAHQDMLQERIFSSNYQGRTELHIQPLLINCPCEVTS